MAQTIFYSWQSDSPNKLNRGFIEEALIKAVENVGKSIAVQEALRDETIEIDMDTKGIPGIPPITDTIFDKISNCAIFVPDLTFVGKTIDGRLIPNPNVLIEYGWALSKLGYSRIIPVMNSAFGEPTWATLPFDMRHLRHPISYILSEETAPKDKAAIKDRLIKQLSGAIQLIVENVIIEDKLSQPEPHQKIPSTFNPASFLDQGEALGKISVYNVLQDSRLETKDVDLYLSNEAQLLLRIFPIVPVELIKSSKAAEDIIRNNLNPMGDSAANRIYARNKHGAFVCSYQDGRLFGLSQLFLNGELWGVDENCLNKQRLMSFAGVDFGYFPMGYVEKVFIMTLDNYMKVTSEKLKLLPPLGFIAGAVNVKDYKMVCKAYGGHSFEGHVVNEHIIYEGQITDYNAAPSDILRPFFELIWEECGLDTPKE